MASMAMENTVMDTAMAMVMSLRIRKTALTPLPQIRILPETNRLYYFTGCELYSQQSNFWINGSAWGDRLLNTLN